MSKYELDLRGHAGRRSTAVFALSTIGGFGEAGTQGLEKMISYAANNAPPGSSTIFVLGCIVAAYVSGDKIYAHIKNGSYWLQKYISQK